MKIVIVGAGEVGSYLCSTLSTQGHEVTVIESSEETARAIDEQYNVKVLEENGSSAETLDNARVDECDFFLAMTSDDKTNLISSSLAKALGARTTITRIHEQTYIDNSYINFQLHFGIDHMINPEALSAMELVKSIRNPGRVAVENFARGKIEAQQVQITERSKLIGKSLKELYLESRLRIGLIEQDEKEDVPNADTVLENGDIVTLFGPPEEISAARKKFDPDSKEESVRVVVYGGGETAIALVRLLKNPRFKVRIIEGDVQVCRNLSEKFPAITVIHGDATSLRLMEEEQIGSADYFIACTKRDEDNIMTGLQASKLGSSHVQILINKTDYEEVIDRLKGTLGVEMTVSPRIATVNEVMRYISPEPYTELVKMSNRKGKILEIKVAHESSCVGKLMKDISWPPHCVVVALLHKFQANVPGADDKILAGDRVVAITRNENVKGLLKLLAAE